MQNLIKQILKDTEELKKMTEELHTPFAGMLKVERKLEVKCVCE
jgi:hypothetical protein